jgi:hypothetical protein
MSLTSRTLLFLMAFALMGARASADPQIEARAQFARDKTEKAFTTCNQIGIRFGKDELDVNYQSRVCLAYVLIRLETRVIELKKRAGAKPEELAPHLENIKNLGDAIQPGTYEALNDYDSLNLYYGILTAKRAQMDLLAEAAKK